MEWVSWRFTTPFQQRIEDIFGRGSTYAASFEKSAKGVEHWHVLSIGHGDYDRLRKFVQRKLNMQGMKWWSKKNSGTFEGALAYTFKCPDNSVEGSRIVKSSDWPSFEYKKWVFSAQTTLKMQEMKEGDVKKLRSWQLTYSNIVDQALYFHRTNGLDNILSLKDTVQQMMEQTKWRPSPQMLREGVPEFYKQDFEFRKGKRPDLDMSWFNSLR